MATIAPALNLRLLASGPRGEYTVTIGIDAALLAALHDCRSVELPEGYR